VEVPLYFLPNGKRKMTYIIAEIGINHNGNLTLAKQLIDAARWCGADCVKFQKRTVGIVYFSSLHQPRESPWGDTLGDQKRGLEFGKEEYDKIALYCDSIGMPWFASAWDIPSLEFLETYDGPFHKVASAMATNVEFLKAVGKTKRPKILSTAMCDEKQIWEAANLTQPEVIMHCVATYPAKEADLNLNYIPKLKAQYSPIKIGYSGHESSGRASLIAVAKGAEVVERHITLDRSMYGSDQAASLEPMGFYELVQQIRSLPAMLGDGEKRITEEEWKVAKKLRYWE